MAIWNSQAAFKVVAAGRRFGKSHLASRELLKEAMMTTNAAGYDLSETVVMYIAPTFDQAKRAVWQKLINAGKMKSQGGLIVNYNINDGWIDLVSGRRIYVRGSDKPEGLRGVGLSYVVLDEYADMKPYVWDEIIEPTLMDVEGQALFIGTPKGKNHFYHLFMNALGTGIPGDTKYNPELWEDWEAFHFKSSDNPHISQKRLAQILERSGRTAQHIKQEIEADFVTGGPKILDADGFQIIDEVPGLVVARSAGVGGAAVRVNDTYGQVFITYDPAGFKTEGSRVSRADEHVVAATYVTHKGDWVVLDMQHGHWDTREACVRILRTLQKNRPCRLGIEQGVLRDALKSPLEEMMREFHIYVTPETLRHHNRSKADRITWALQGRLERRKIHLLRGPWNDWLLNQAADFPSPLAHDDGIDALAYVDQMAVSAFSTAEAEDDDDEWQPLDELAGY